MGSTEGAGEGGVQGVQGDWAAAAVALQALAVEIGRLRRSLDLLLVDGNAAGLPNKLEI